MKRTITFIVSAVLIFSFSACQNKVEVEEKATQSQAVPSGPITYEKSAAPAGGGIPPKFQVIVPDQVKSGWSGVILILQDKETGDVKELEVRLGEEIVVPDTNLMIKVGYFLPDFTMAGSGITSASNKLNNPSAGVAVYEKEARIFPVSDREWGWLYANMPTIHSLEHDRYSLTLKKGVKSGSE